MSERHPAESILKLSTAYWASRCLHAVAEFGIADALGDEPEAAAALAKRTGTNPDALHRILRALCNHGIFALRDGLFAHNAASRLLRSDNPASMRSLARMMGINFHWDVYRDLAHSLKTGESAGYKVQQGGLFEHLRTHPEDSRIFNEAMVGKSFGQIGPVLGAYDFSPFKMIGDIGGGVGHLLAAILDSAPGAKGVLFDLPEVIAQAKSRPNPRITYVPGDFFKDPIPACDLYVMMTVIHDWSDADAIAILKRLRGNAPPSAKLLLVEAIVDESATESFPIDMDIEMLVFASGRERTQAQWQALLSKAGFKFSRAVPLGGLTGLVEASVT
jgi:O-methyltransferase/methyltransferase family protein